MSHACAADEYSQYGSEPSTPLDGEAYRPDQVRLIHSCSAGMLEMLSYRAEVF